METESVVDENHKKGRVRRKHALHTILNQMHFYFSDSNLSRDRFLAQKLQESEYVDLSVFLTFNKISKLTSSVEEIAKAIKKSEQLSLNEDSTKVKRVAPVKVKSNQDECTIYVQTLQPDTTHEWLINVFSEFGKVEYVSIPRYAHNKLAKGFAFIEYAKEEQVKDCLHYFQTIGARISQIDAEELCSNKTYEESGNVGSMTEDVKVEMEEQEQEQEQKQIESNEKKRKHSDDEEAAPGPGEDGSEKNAKNKKVKTEVGENTEVKPKKKTGKRKALIKELGLQVLTKLEWKKLRNRYWDMQRKKMKQLKQHLNRRRLHQNNYLDIKSQHQGKPQEHQPSGDNTEDVKSEETQDGYTPGVIVRLKLMQPWTEAKKIKNELKHLDGNIQYVEVPISLTSDEVYLRFITAENAANFCTTKIKGEGVVLTDEEEKQYWEKIKVNRDARLHKDVKKQRGRDKLLKRAERELGKHIRFDATDD